MRFPRALYAFFQLKFLCARNALSGWEIALWFYDFQSTVLAKIKCHQSNQPTLNPIHLILHGIKNKTTKVL